MDQLLDNIDQKMKKSVQNLAKRYEKVNTGQANVTILDGIKINYYGTPTPIKQVANVSIPEPRLIVIKPWDKTTLGDIEKAILASNIGITPDNDGNVIRLPFQALTEEKRHALVKNVKELAEEAKISVRNIRRDGNKEIEALEKDSEISEDQMKISLEEVQEMTDSATEKINDLAKQKEKQIMKI